MWVRARARAGAVRLALLLAVVPRFAGGRILGFHLDDERCTGPDSRFGNTSTLVPPCLAVLHVLKSTMSLCVGRMTARIDDECVRDARGLPR